MSWYEYNEELHIKNERAIAYEEGQEKEKESLVAFFSIFGYDNTMK